MTSARPAQRDDGLRRARVAVSLAFLTFGAQLGLWFAHIPEVAKRLGLDPARLGLGTLTIGIVGLVMQPVAGVAMTRFGTRRTTMILLPGFVLAETLLINAPSQALFFVFAALVGLVGMPANIGNSTMAAELERARGGRPVMSSFHAFFSVGGVLGSLLGGVMIGAGYGNGRGAIVAGSVLLVSALWATTRALEVAPQRLAPRVRPRFAIPAVAILGLGLIVFCATLIEGSVGTFGALYLATAKHANPAIAASGYAMFSVAMALTRFAGGSIVERLGQKALIIASGTMMAAGELVVVVAPSPLVGALGFLIVAAGAANVAPVLTTAAANTPGVAQSIGVAALTTCMTLGLVIGPPVIGFIAEARGLGTAFGVLAGLGVMVAVLAAIRRWDAGEKGAPAPPRAHSKKIYGALALLALVGVTVGAASSGAAVSTKQIATRAIHVDGRRFVDARGRTVILRGVNLAGSSKLPPFVPYDDPRALDALRGFGMNVVRLPFIWEAYEPTRGVYREDYLAKMSDVAREAYARGIYTIVDFHQDGFSRYSLDGCGSGFPSWAVPTGVGIAQPDNRAERCARWFPSMFTNTSMQRSWRSFFANDGAVRDAFLSMTSRVSRAFSKAPGVIGYDLLNEPWGEDGNVELLYADEGKQIRANDPSAILFVEEHISPLGGFGNALGKPRFDNIAYAPHFYSSTVMRKRAYDGNPDEIDRAWKTMNDKAASWGVPLFVGEFGMFAEATRARDYVIREYEDLDAFLASGTQWNATPRWTEAAKDGWNGEDLAIVLPSGALRPNFRVQPFPRATAGTPSVFRYTEDAGSGGEMVYSWQAEPSAGATEIYLPRRLFDDDANVAAKNATCIRNGDVLTCRANAGDASVRVTGSAPR
jgi:endoglycosylceramidase